MDRRSFLLTSGFFAFGVPPAVRGAKKSQAKGPEVEVLEAVGKLQDGKIAIDGRVKILGERPVRKLTITYDILDSDKGVLSSQKGEIDDDQLAPGTETSFHAEMAFPARAVSFRVGFEDTGERELRAVKTGPYPLE